MSTEQPSERVLRIRGGARLTGSVRIGGAKNAALKAMAAALLTREEVTFYNVPCIADVLSMAKLMEELGATVDYNPATERLTLQVRDVQTTVPPSDLFKATRASVVVTGPMLARMGEITFRAPGGDQIGKRPIDMHLRGFQKLGTAISYDGDEITAHVNRLKGAHIYMDYPSHTGTESIMMAATLASGTTIIRNASYEPEIIWLGKLLNRMGARISGLGTPYITIEGVERLKGVSEIVMPDRLEAATYAVAGAMTGGSITLTDVVYNDLIPVTAKLREAGCDVWNQESQMLIRAPRQLTAVDIQTLPYPGFPTDSQSTIVPLLTQAVGVSVVQERIYEDRLRYTDQLRKMGADIRVNRLRDDQGDELLATTAHVYGPTPLTGTRVQALDIRSAVAVVLAGLVADGETEVTDVYHIDRGYAGFVDKLEALGASIEDTGVANSFV